MDMFSNNTDFYPTPTEVIYTMMLGEDFIGKTILEPSAGSGNIVKWLRENGAGEVIACENDPTLRKLLQGECELIAENFLSVRPEDISHVDYIVMNPPFSEGPSKGAGCCRRRKDETDTGEVAASSAISLITKKLFGLTEFYRSFIL